MSGVRRYLDRLSAVGTANTVDLTVPAEQIWLVKSVLVRIVATATVDDRFIRIELVSGGVVLAAAQTAAAITASQTGLVSFGGANIRDAAAVGAAIQVPFPEFVAKAGEIIRARDADNADVLDIVTVFANVDRQAAF